MKLDSERARSDANLVIQLNKLKYPNGKFATLTESITPRSLLPSLNVGHFKDLDKRSV